MQKDFKEKLNKHLKTIENNTGHIQKGTALMSHDVLNISKVAKAYSAVIMAITYTQNHDKSIPKELRVTAPQLNSCIKQTKESVKSLNTKTTK